MSIRAMTRYGKTTAATLGVAKYIMLNPDRKIPLIGPQKEQAGILRRYMADWIVESPMLLELSDIDTTGAGRVRIKKEVSKNRLTFKNGCEYEVFSAYHDANRIMGFGGDLVIVDEACLVGGTAYAKIMRMLGDDPTISTLIELYNPWNTDNKAYEHFLDPAYHKIHVGWQQAVLEGRTTLDFVVEMERDLTPLEFVVLYKSDFPEQSEDSLFSLADINRAKGIKMDIGREITALQEELSRPEKLSEGEYAGFQKDASEYRWRISCDVADKGLDETVIFDGFRKGPSYQVIGTYAEPKSENTSVAGKINMRIRERVELYPDFKGEVIIDIIGIGTGVVSMVKEYVRNKEYQNKVKVIGAHFGEGFKKKDKRKLYFQNQKAFNYFRLSDMMKEGLVHIPDAVKLTTQLVSIKWDLTSTEKKIIVDPEDYSPDWACALVYFTWMDARQLVYAV